MTIPRVKRLAVAVGVASFSPFLHAADQDTVVVTATGFEQKIPLDYSVFLRRMKLPTG
jgi:outer membrane receptor for ferrienterochelin and colicins